MVVSTIRIPTYVNAVELASFIMEKRKGVRFNYTADSNPSLREINDRLLASEYAIAKELNTQWRPDKYTYETLWRQYDHTLFYGRGYYNRYNKQIPPSTVSLLHHPIISIDKLECIVNNTVLDIIADPNYTEGWSGGNAYYIDYRNGIINFLSYRPRFMTPMKIEYTHGRREHQDGYSIYSGTVTSDIGHPPTEESISSEYVSVIGQFNGKLLKITSGVATDFVYRIYTSGSFSDFTTISTLPGYTLLSDGVVVGDTYEIYSIPHDIQEMIKIYTYLGILVADPTYQHSFTNPFEEPNPLFPQFEWLSLRYQKLSNQRQSTMQLLN